MSPLKRSKSTQLPAAVFSRHEVARLAAVFDNVFPLCVLLRKNEQLSCLPPMFAHTGDHAAPDLRTIDPLREASPAQADGLTSGNVAFEHTLHNHSVVHVRDTPKTSGDGL